MFSFERLFHAASGFMSGLPSDPGVSKAEEDYESAIDLSRQKKRPVNQVVCFHAQQCAEKHLKAFLAQNGASFRKTHDLDELRRSCEQFDDSFRGITDETLTLNAYAISSRYPGPGADQNEAQQAIAAMKKVRRFVQSKLGLK